MSSGYPSEITWQFRLSSVRLRLMDGVLPNILHYSSFLSASASKNYCPKFSRLPARLAIIAVNRLRARCSRKGRTVKGRITDLSLTGAHIVLPQNVTLPVPIIDLKFPVFSTKALDVVAKDGKFAQMESEGKDGVRIEREQLKKQIKEKLSSMGI
jgi:hypothetical protein